MTNKKYNVIGVDDEVYIGKSIVRSFNLYNNFTVKYYTNPLELLEEIQKTKYDVMITDGNMPEMTGLDLLRKVSELKIDIVKVMIAGNYRIIDPTKAENLADLFYIKPVNMQSVIQNIEELLISKENK